MREQHPLAAKLVAELADRFEKRQAFDIADRAADLAQDEIFVGEVGGDELLDCVGDVRDDLNRRAEIFAAPLAADHRRINPPGRDAVALARGDTNIALVMAEIEIGLGAVIGHEDFPVLIRAHRAGIDIKVGVELAEAHFEAARLQQRTQRRRAQTLAERGDHAAGNKDEPRHGPLEYSKPHEHPTGNSAPRHRRRNWLLNQLATDAGSQRAATPQAPAGAIPRPRKYRPEP